MTTFASRSYPDANPVKAAEKAITMMMFKLEGQLIRRHPEYQMESRLLLDKIDFRSSHAVLGDGKRYELESAYFPTILLLTLNRTLWKAPYCSVMWIIFIKKGVSIPAIMAICCSMAVCC